MEEPWCLPKPVMCPCCDERPLPDGEKECRECREHRLRCEWRRETHGAWSARANHEW